jgi:hypothetical protein
MKTLMNPNKQRLQVVHHFQLGALVQAFETCGVALNTGAAWARESRNAIVGLRTARLPHPPIRRKSDETKSD